jgi:hypothetical protein
VVYSTVHTVQESNKNAAEWRLRIQRRDAVTEELRNVFPDNLGVLTQGSLLQVLGEGKRIVECLPRASRYREVIRESQLATEISQRALKLLLKLPKEKYSRIEDAYAAFGSGILLAVGPEAGNGLLESMNSLKLWCIEHGTRNVDQVTTYLKWLIKVAQGVALNCKPTIGESYFPGYDFKRKRILRTPFAGNLSFINDLLVGRRDRAAGLSLEEHRAIAQVANSSRALPFPSEKQVQASVLETLDLITEIPEPMSVKDKELYYGGLAYTGLHLGPFKGLKTHSSLTNSGCWERSQKEGGRAQEIVSPTRSLTDTLVTEISIKGITDTIDCFGEPVLPPATAAMVLTFIRENKDVNRPLTLGDVLYVPPHEAFHMLQRSQERYNVPKYLGNIIILVCSKLLTEYGEYSKKAVYDDNSIILFKRGEKVKFLMGQDWIPVKAALSEESGMKTRLVTAAPAAITQIGQLMRHTMAADLSRDPFLRVGFEEADKLWETLKAYRKFRPTKSPKNSDLHFISLDLKEATYRMPHEVLRMNHLWMERRYAGNPVWDTFSDLFGTFKRVVDLKDIRSKGLDAGLWPDNPTSLCGSFMGDSLSFMHLTIMVSSCVWQASAASHFGSIYKRPDLRYFDGWVSRPLGQTVGDDAVILGASTLFADEFDVRLNAVNVRMSKIHSRSKDSGTFCENWFCVPIDDGTLIRDGYPEDSLFGEIWFLDTIKGSLLSGRSKVKADGADPFIGQARMLSKQIQWHPLTWMRRAAPKLLWARNFMAARSMGTINAHLPTSLGGLDIAIGNMDPIEDPRMMERYAPFLEGILLLPIEDFLKWQMLLTGITRSNPKGVPWANDELLIAIIVSKIKTFAESNVLSDIPSQVLAKGRGDVQRYMAETLGLTSVRNLTDLLTRLEAFKAFWDGKAAAQPFLTISSKGLRPRFNKVWSRIREKVTPSVVTSSSWSELGKKFDKRTWGLLFNKDDPALLEIYEGMPTLSVEWGRLGLLASG